jgi:hypothetical protein
MNFMITKGCHRLSIHAVWVFVILFLLFFYHFMPPGQCLFHDYTGLPCLSCGVTRAANSLFDGDLMGMIYFNPLIILFCAGLFFFSLFKFVEYIFKLRVRLRVNKKVASAIRIIAVLMIVANWAYLIVTGR